MDIIKKYVQSLEQKAIPQLSVNCVIFSFHEKMLKVVVNKVTIEDTTMTLLPGGFVMQTEDLTVAVERIVRESTGLEKILFSQFAVFGDASRSFGGDAAYKKLKTTENKKLFDWISKRFISICYLALVDFNKIELKPTQFLEGAEWLSVSEGKILSLDHTEILRSAHAFLAKELPYAPIESNLLPSRFTLPELHALIEAILDRSIDRPNFRRKILKSNQIVKVGQNSSGKRRPADLYTFKHGRKTNLIDDYKLGF